MKKSIVKGVVNYIFAMIFSIIFGLFLDANVGWFILLALVLAPLMSVFFAWLSSRRIELFCEMDDAFLAKGDTCVMKVHVRNRSIFPTPPIAIELVNGAGVRSDNNKLIVSVLSRAAVTFQVVFKAKICGKSVAGIEMAQVTDYSGLFSFSLKNQDYSSLQRNVAVIPDIAEISDRDDNIIKVMQTSMNMDDSDDTVESAAYNFGGFPGYDSREYVPGDPMKRVNWKQSAKRGRLLVRLDDEMSSRSVNVVLDSVFNKDDVDIYSVAPLLPFRDFDDDELIPAIGQAAVENALGIMQVLIRHGYKINFYAMWDKQFVKYEIIDDVDLENVRLELANYSFCEEENVDRLPKEETLYNENVGIFSTPNSYEEAGRVLERDGDNLYTTAYSVVGEALKQGAAAGELSFSDLESSRNRGSEPGKAWSIKEKLAALLKNRVKQLIVPYFLALLLSVSVFTVFDVPVISYWTIWQMTVCAVIMAFCEYARKHKVIGTLIIVALVVVVLNSSFDIMFRSGGNFSYMRWFMSGGDTVETIPAYLITLLMIFTVFFAMVVYYFTRVLYRTSFLMLVSMIPLIVYVKVMKPVNMTQVVFITALNIAAFLINRRTAKDKGKRIIGYMNGLVSAAFYAACFLMVGLALPEAETKYYYIFEDTFLGGNITQEIPQEYSDMSEYSGNADGFSQMNNRKLYTVSAEDTGKILYLKRQTFDLYDFDNDRWYSDYMYSGARYPQEEWMQEQQENNLSMFLEALSLAEKYEPGTLEKYGIIGSDKINRISGSYNAVGKSMTVQATNYSSAAYITPPGTFKITVLSNDSRAEENTYVSHSGAFQIKAGYLSGDIEYEAVYYDEETLRNVWIAAGGANCDLETYQTMLYDVEWILKMNDEDRYADVVSRYKDSAWRAYMYRENCQENTELISEKVKDLALEITKNCSYDWEKAEALQEYFKNNDFVYDLSYDAPDDSVEYFLFVGKTGTCSDFASAYVLMARAAGLTARYVEGFVPKEEQLGEYVVRSDCGHAYAEVYIPNVGYVVYEATQPAIEVISDTGFGISAYFLYAGIRVLAVFGVVSVLILSVLFVNRFVAPCVSEAHFAWNFRRAVPEKAVVLLYRRIQDKTAKKLVEGAKTCTPYEYGEKLEAVAGCDISELVYMVERSAYEEKGLENRDKIRAKSIYKNAVRDIKECKKKNKKIRKN